MKYYRIVINLQRSFDENIQFFTILFYIGIKSVATFDMWTRKQSDDNVRFISNNKISIACISIILFHLLYQIGEHSGAAVERSHSDREVAGSNLTRRICCDLEQVT